MVKFAQRYRIDDYTLPSRHNTMSLLNNTMQITSLEAENVWVSPSSNMCASLWASKIGRFSRCRLA